MFLKTNEAYEAEIVCRLLREIQILFLNNIYPRIFYSIKQIRLEALICI